jgi:hypothetical protein
MNDESAQLVNVVGFALPAKQFTIEAELTEARPLPVVEEMIARLLHLIGDTNPAELQMFLGLQDHEFESVLNALDRHRMTVVKPDGRLGLTQLARDAIRNSPQGIPRLVETRVRPIRVAFDLATYHLVADSTAGYAMGLPELTPTSVRKVSAAEVASRALRSHFHLLRTRFSDLRKAELYKVIRAEPIRPLLVPVEVAFRLRADSANNLLEREILPSDAIDAVPHEELEPLISRALCTAPEVPDQGMDVQRFCESFRDDAVQKFCSGSEFDLDAYMRAFRGNRLQFSDKLTRPIVGPLYLATNRQLLQRVLTLKGETPHVPFAVWLAPDVRYWGSTPLVRDFCSEVEAGGVFDREPTQMVTCLRSGSPAEDHRLRSAHSRRLTSGLCYSGPSANPHWEVLIAPNRFACVLIHIYLNGGPEVSVPLGHLTVDPERVARVEDYFRQRVMTWCDHHSLWNESAPSDDARAYILGSSVRQ